MRKYMMAAIALLIAAPAWGYSTSDPGAVTLTVEAYATVTLDDLTPMVMSGGATTASSVTVGALQYRSNAAGTVSLVGGGTNLHMTGNAADALAWVDVVSAADATGLIAALGDSQWSALIKDGPPGWLATVGVTADTDTARNIMVAAKGKADWDQQNAGTYSGTLVATITVAAP